MFRVSQWVRSLVGDVWVGPSQTPAHLCSHLRQVGSSVHMARDDHMPSHPAVLKPLTAPDWLPSNPNSKVTGQSMWSTSHWVYVQLWLKELGRLGQGKFTYYTEVPFRGGEAVVREWGNCDCPKQSFTHPWQGLGIWDQLMDLIKSVQRWLLKFLPVMLVLMVLSLWTYTLLSTEPPAHSCVHTGSR